MEKIAIDGPKMPIGFLSSLWRGIEIVNANPWILILPVLLDAFLWFGPQLSVFTLAAPVFDWMASNAAGDPASLLAVDLLRQSIEHYNLFSLLSFIPMFPPSVLADTVIPLFSTGVAAGTASVRTPLGIPVVFPVAGGLEFLLLAMGLPLSSILIGSAYWVMAGRTTQKASWPIRESIVRWGRTVAVVGILCVSFIILIVGFGFPILFVIWMIGLVSQEIGIILSQMVVFLGGSFLFWMVLFFMFSAHGTVLFADDIRSAIWNSVNTSRWMYPLSIWMPSLLLMAYFLSTLVWSLAPDDTWAGALGVLGNAYTSSIVVAASMVYYIDKRRWIAEVRTYLQSRVADKNPPPAA